MRDVSTLIASLVERPDLKDEHHEVGGSAWPEFMVHDPVAMANWGKIIRYFAQDQLSMLIDGEIAAVMNLVPIHLDMPLEDLPDRGVDWAVEKAVADHEAGVAPNTLVGLQVVVNHAFRGRKLSEVATQGVIEHAKTRGCERVLLPVRPSDKHAYPLIPMERYLAWKNEDGLPFDGWLRVHAKLSGETIKICHQSMIIPGTISEWEAWTGQRFPDTGAYIVPFALNPVEMDVEQDLGRYVEPNVWVVHKVG